MAYNWESTLLYTLSNTTNWQKCSGVGVSLPICLNSFSMDVPSDQLNIFLKIYFKIIVQQISCVYKDDHNTLFNHMDTKKQTKKHNNRNLVKLWHINIMIYFITQHSDTEREPQHIVKIGVQNIV